jgi:hypothetical protein
MAFFTEAISDVKCLLRLLLWGISCMQIMQGMHSDGWLPRVVGEWLAMT